MEILAAIIVIPVLILVFYFQVAKRNFIGQLIITTVVVVFNLLVILKNALLWLIWGKTGSSGIYGTSGWLEGSEKRKTIGQQNSGLVLGTGQISEENTYQHCLILGPTGTGKTVNYLIPNILTLALDNIDCSCVVSDPKGELFQFTSGAMTRAGFDVKVLAPRKLSSSIRYNPLDYINQSSQATVDEIASMLIDIQLKSNKADAFWNLQGKSAASLALRLLTSGRESMEHRNLYNLRYILNQWSPDSDRLDNFIARNSDISLMADIRGFMNQDKVTHGAISSAKAALVPFSDPELATLTSFSNFDLKQLRRKRTILYVQISEADQNYYSFLQTLFYQQLLNMCMENKVEGEPFKPIRIFIEEAGNLGRIPSLRTALAAARSRKVSISLVLQSKSQLDLVYGHLESKILIENCLSKLVLPSLDNESTKYIESLLGTQTLRYANPHKKEDEPKYSERQRPLMFSDEIRRLPNGKAILIQGNLKPILLDMEPYFKNPYFSKLAKIPPVEINYNYGTEELKLIDLGNSKLRKVA